MLSFLTACQHTKLSNISLFSYNVVNITIHKHNAPFKSFYCKQIQQKMLSLLLIFFVGVGRLKHKYWHFLLLKINQYSIVPAKTETIKPFATIISDKIKIHARQSSQSDRIYNTL